MKAYKEKLKTEFIKHRSYLTKGMAEIYAFRAIIMFVAAAGVILKYLIEVELPFAVYAITGLIMSFACWLIGYYWDKSHLYDTEADFGNKRNPAIRALLKRK